MEVKQGVLFLLDNKKRKRKECLQYYGGYLEDIFGVKGFFLFNVKDLHPRYRVELHGLDLDLGRMYPMNQPPRYQYLVKLSVGGQEFCYKMGRQKLNKSIRRTASNPEDVLEQSWWTKFKEFLT